MRGHVAPPQGAGGALSHPLPPKQTRGALTPSAEAPSEGGVEESEVPPKPLITNSVVGLTPRVEVSPEFRETPLKKQCYIYNMKKLSSVSKIFFDVVVTIKKNYTVIYVF